MIKATKEAKKVFSKWPPRVRAAMTRLIQSGRCSHNKYLGRYGGMYIVKSKEYRAVCRKDGDDIIVEFCGVRGDVYKRSRRSGRNISA